MKLRELHAGVIVYHRTSLHWGEGRVSEVNQKFGVTRRFLIHWSGRNLDPEIWCGAAELVKTPVCDNQAQLKMSEPNHGAA